MMRSLDPNECNSYYRTYTDLVEELDFLKTLKEQLDQTPTWLNSYTTDQWNHRYAADKWSVKEVWLHLIDAERIFAYRALRIGRGDETALAGFDQNTYIPNLRADERSPESVITEYKTVRAATISLFENMDQEMLDRMGTASDSPLSVLAVAHILVGHEKHHSTILRERYGL